MTAEYVNKIVEVRRVIDADTYLLVIDVGFHLTTVERVRLLGVNAPEARTPEGPTATQWATAWLDAHLRGLYARTYLTDSFGRWLAELYVPATADTPRADLATDMLAAGMAVVYRR